MHSIVQYNLCAVFIIVCRDDPNWKDNNYGDGSSGCAHMTPDWCENYGDYSTEAKEFCPSKCDSCPGIICSLFIVNNSINCLLI